MSVIWGGADTRSKVKLGTGLRELDSRWRLGHSVSNQPIFRKVNFKF